MALGTEILRTPVLVVAESGIHPNCPLGDFLEASIPEALIRHHGYKVLSRVVAVPVPVEFPI